jgi:hypothetical protein
MILTPIDTSEPTNVVEFKPRERIGDSVQLTEKQYPSWIYQRTGECAHKQVLVDECKQELECADCHEKINPIWYLMMMAREEGLWKRRQEKYKEALAKISERKRTTCQHCGKMTRISNT